MNWKDYEQAIVLHFQNEFPDATVQKNAHLVGRYSGVSRQVDVLVTGTVADFEQRIVIDAKHRKRPIDVTDVEAFIGYCADLDVHRGVLIAPRGYTSAALARAHNDMSDIELDVLNFDELAHHQGLCGIPYSGGHGVLISAPFGWVLDAERNGAGLPATLYQRGRDFPSAVAIPEWMYIQFWSRDSDAISLEALIDAQDARIRASEPGVQIVRRPGPVRSDAVTAVRIAKNRTRGTCETTGFVDFGKFIMFCVLNTREMTHGRNLRKLLQVLRGALPLGIKIETDGGPTRRAEP
ncbi:MAG: restriction endonuclease [Burkholderiaceae bacterium]